MSIQYQPQGQAYVPAAYPPSQGFIGQQPVQGQWVSAPAVPLNCPPGLEYLTAIDQLLVHQKVELLEAFTGFETNNKYTIKNSMGQKVFYAVEDTGCCTRNCCGPIRPFDIKILDHTHRERLEVMAPPGNVIGFVSQEWSICYPKFRIEDSSGSTVLRIEGPFCRFSCCGDVEFQVLSSDGKTQLGKITKQWSGLVREMFTDADNFGISFPLDLDVNVKAVLLGALFLIDYMFFEKSGNQENDRPGMF